MDNVGLSKNEKQDCFKITSCNVDRSPTAPVEDDPGKVEAENSAKALSTARLVMVLAGLWLGVLLVALGMSSKKSYISSAIRNYLCILSAIMDIIYEPSFARCSPKSQTTLCSAQSAAQYPTPTTPSLSSLGSKQHSQLEPQSSSPYPVT